MHKPLPVALAAALLLGVHAHAQTPAPTRAARPPAPAGAPALAAANVIEGQSIAPTLPLEFTLAAPLPPAQGQITLLLNGNDIGSFLQSGDARHFVLQPADFPLPAGPVRLELVFEPASGGEPVTLLRAQVQVQAGAQGLSENVDPGVPPDATALAGAAGSAEPGNAGAPGAPGTVGAPAEPQAGQVGSAPAGPQGLVPKAVLQTSVTSTSRNANGVVTESIVRELGLQLGLRYETEKDGTRIAAAGNFIGNSQRAKAVRFGYAGADADKVDLNDYLVEFQTATARLSLGHATIAGNPLLGQSFSNRGISGAYRFNPAFDVALTSQFATALVGGQQLPGFTDARQRVNAVTVGWEAIPDQPGVLRVEGTGLSGEIDRQGLAPPGAGAAANPERSHGLGLRVQWTPVDSIYKLEAAYARSTSIQRDAFGVDQTTSGRAAYFADGSAKLVDTPADAGRGARRLVLRLRHEFAAGGYRSIAGGMTGDVRRTLLGVEGQYGVVQGQWAHTQSENNVDRVTGLPVLGTTSDTLSLALPLSQLMAEPPPVVAPEASAQDASNANALPLTPPPPAGSWWPTLQAGLQRNRQRPVVLPATVVVGLVPAITTSNATLNAQWNRSAWTWSAGLTYGMLDNQQPGFTAQDQRSRGIQAQVQWQATPTLATTFGARRSRATATDTGISQIQNGTDVGVAWQVGQGWSLNGQYNRNGNYDSIYSQISRGRSWQLSAGKSWEQQIGPQYKVPVQLSLRTQQQIDRSDTIFGGILTQNGQRMRTWGVVLSATL